MHRGQLFERGMRDSGAATVAPTAARLAATGWQRRDVLGLLGGSLVLGLQGCGGGGDSAGTSGSGVSASAVSSGSSASAASSSAASSATSSASSSASSSAASGAGGANAAALWGTTGWDATPVYSTVALVPTLADFASIAAVQYTLRTANTASGAFETFNVAAYRMGRFLVTNANWKAYCNANGISSFPLYWSGGGYPSGKENHPVFYISYNQALGYCNWLSSVLGLTCFIPGEAEWEWAALGTTAGTAVDGSGYYRSVQQGNYVFPWGATSSISYSGGVLSTRYCCNAVCAAYVLSSGMMTLSYAGDTTVTGGTGYDAATDTAVLAQVMQLSATGGVTGWQYDSASNASNADFANSDQYRRLVSVWGGHTTPVGNYESGKSALGCYDMSGNAYEWTSSVGIASNGVEAGTSVNILRGGSWYATSNSASCIARGEGRAPTGGYHSVGFRVACR